MSKDKKSKLVLVLSSIFFFMSVMVMTFQIGTTEVAAQTGCEEEYAEVCCGTLCLNPNPDDPEENYCIKHLFDPSENEYQCCFGCD